LVVGCRNSDSRVDFERRFDVTTRDLGGVRIDSDYSANYRISNTTSTPIEVVRIKTSCGCVAASYDPSEIPPGGHRDVTLKLSTHGQTVLGPIAKHASVEFGSGQKVSLTLTATLESDFDIEPRRLQFSADEPDRTLKVTRRQLDPASFSRMLLVANPDRYHVLEESAPSPDHRLFRITMKEAPAGAGLPEIYFTDEAGAKPLPFSTVGCSRTGPTLRPSACVILRTGGDLPPAQRFELVDFESQPLKLTAVEGVDEQARKLLEVAFDPAQDPKSFSVSLAPPSDSGPTSRPAAGPTMLFVAVEFAALDQATTGRLLLPCHLVTVPSAKKRDDQPLD
jgi:hypothetical protein